MSYIHEFIFEDDDGTEYVAESDTKVIFEKSYGQDADGNRGTPTYFAELEDIRLYKESHPEERLILIPEKDNKALYGRALKYYARFEMNRAEQIALDIEMENIL